VNVIFDLLVAVGQVFLIMLASGILIGIGFFLKEWSRGRLKGRERP
jgi:hypothetical protein